MSFLKKESVYNKIFKVHCKLVFLMLFILTSNSLYPRINFIHVPKCGGTTIHSILEKYFSVSEIYEDKRVPISKENACLLKDTDGFLLDIPDIDDKLLVSGHFPYWFFKQKDQDIDLSFNIVVLREPISRYISNFRYQQRERPDLPIHKSPDNFICRLLCSNPCLEGDELLEDSINTLNSMDFIIFMDEMQSDLPLLLETLGLSIFEEEIPCINNNYIDKGSFDDETMRIIYKRNELDIKLYQYAVENFKDKQHPHMLNKIQKFPSLQKLMEKKNKFSYTFDLPIPGSGWYYRENVNTDSPVYCWVRGNKGKILFNIDQSTDYIMHFQAEKITKDIQISIKINGHDFIPKRLNHEPFSLYEVKIPKSILTQETTEITFSSNRSYTPREINLNHLDNRPLSIALNKIIFSPIK